LVATDVTRKTEKLFANVVKKESFITGWSLTDSMESYLKDEFDGFQYKIFEIGETEGNADLRYTILASNKDAPGYWHTIRENEFVARNTLSELRTSDIWRYWDIQMKNDQAGQTAYGEVRIRAISYG